MTRRLGGTGSSGLAALASLSLAATLACGMAMTGCGGDNNPQPAADSGPETGPVDGGGKQDVNTPDTGTPDVKGGDVNMPPDSNLPTCATPTFAPNGGTVAAGMPVTITSTTGGVIYFTTDGTLPTHSSRAIQSGGTIVVSQTEPVNAIAFNANVCNDSMEGSAMFTVPPVDSGPPDVVQPPPPCPTPILNPDGGTVTGNVVITAPGLPDGGYIFFTTDNTLATESSPIYNAGNVGIQVPANETIHAISSTRGTVCSDSPEAVGTYTVPPPPPVDSGAPPPVPTFSPTGAQATQANDFPVTLTDPSATAIICYRMGASGAVTAPTCTTGANPTCSGGSLTYSSPITVTGPTTTAGQVELDAIACNAAGTSAVGKSLYTLQAATPTMTPAAGPYAYSSTLTGAFQSATAGATIFYTINGAAPSCGTPVAGQLTYAGPFALQSGSYQAVACKTGYQDSAPSAAAAITVILPAPTITPAAGTYAKAITEAVANGGAVPSGAWLCSTALAAAATTPVPACGTTPNTCATGTLGATPPAVANGGSIQAIACAPAGLSNSTITPSGPYNLVLGTPFVNPNATNNAGAALTSYTVPGGGVTTLTAGEATGNLAPGWFCFQKDPQAGAPPACGATASTCTTGTPTSATTGDLTVGPTAYAQGDSVSVIACPTAASGYAASAVATLNFIGTGQLITPSVAPAGAANITSITNPVVANPN
ncbi:MAG: chitobiase/beta-hexosaminidase C-terminal domain-containing protein, partial [Myxococcales bacterium]|nr:chitobiase/beta-hexosaminidase C-terminal domain-containing protein [Myxococcales bacterium]